MDRRGAMKYIYFIVVVLLSPVIYHYFGTAGCVVYGVIAGIINPFGDILIKE